MISMGLQNLVVLILLEVYLMECQNKMMLLVMFLCLAMFKTVIACINLHTISGP